MGITRNTGDNLGGIRRLWFCLSDQLAPYFSGNVCTMTQAQFNAVFQEIEFILGDAYARRGTGSTNHGPFRELKLVVEVKKMTTAKEAFILENEGAEGVAVYQDHDGDYILFGQPDFPVEFASDYDGGRRPADGQAYTISLTGKHPIKSPSLIIQ